MFKFRNLFILFICSIVLSSCGKKDFPELRAENENNVYAEALQKENIENTSSKSENTVAQEGKVIIASIATEKDKKAEIVSAVREVPENEGTVILASAAKEASVDVKSKPILKKNNKSNSIDKNPVFKHKKPATGNILAAKQKNKIKSMEATDALIGKNHPQETRKQPLKEEKASNEPSVTYQIDTFYFDNGSSVLSSEYVARVKEIAKTAKEKNATLYILGFASSRTNDTDYVSHKMANFKASLARAENVADAFIKAGIKEDKVLLEALSDSKPAFLEVMPEGERLNRRVEVYIGY